MSGEAARKRKADQISADLHDGDDDDAENTPPHLPAPVWGHVLDFMPYSEVRSALLVGKHIAVEAVKYVQTLNIMKSRQMRICAARRFANVEEVNIMCLLELTEEEHDVSGDLFSISLDVSSRAAPFFGVFSKLARGFIGGLDSDGDRQTYDNDVVRGGKGSDVYRSLLTAYVGAIKTGALSENIDCLGMQLWSLRDSSCREESSNCQWCKDILSHFPLNRLLRDLVATGNIFCQTEQEVWDIVRKRQDIDKCLSEVSEDIICEELDFRFSCCVVESQFRAAVIEELPEKWRLEAQSSRLRNLYVCFMSKIDFLELDDLIEKGFEPKHVTRTFFFEKFKFNIGAVDDHHGSVFNTWTRTTVKELAARGFPVDFDSIPAIDDKYCPIDH